MARAATDAGSRVAVIGTGIAGMSVAYALCRRHDITVFESDSRLGGHVHTHEVADPSGTINVDTGFIVFNARTYPTLVKLFAHLGVKTRQSDMSFSVRCDATDFEYNGTSINSLLAQRTNALKPAFWRMVRDILRFNREASQLLTLMGTGPTLREFLRERNFSGWFVERYLIPMSAAIWSAEPEGILDFPVRFLARFFHNHGMLTVDERPQWETVVGGSSTYAKALCGPWQDRVRLASPVTSIRRLSDRVEVTSRGVTESFDGVVVAAHTDQALALLADPSREESEVLGSIPYQENEAVLHTDSRLLPRRRLARAAWNYHLVRGPAKRASVTYWMNRLQGLSATNDWCVTLNRTRDIDPAKVVKTMTYHHPVFSQTAVAAQDRHREIQGKRRTWFCGAWMRFGFHEDGIYSAGEVLRDFELTVIP